MRISALFLLTATLFAETHTFIAEQYYKTFSHAHPVAKAIKAGDIVVTKTVDSAGVDYKGEQKTTGPGGNPLTGPFFVEGAEPGDALVVEAAEGAAESHDRL